MITAIVYMVTIVKNSYFIQLYRKKTLPLHLICGIISTFGNPITDT